MTKKTFLKFGRTPRYLSNSSKDLGCIIKFKQGDLGYLRREILADLSNEQFAILLGKKVSIAGNSFVNVFDVRFLNNEDYLGQSLTHLSLNKEFIGEILVEVQNRFDVDTIIDVHTHPFSSGNVGFSGVDDRDERNFTFFLAEHFENLNYASIVFSQTEYSARIWKMENGNTNFQMALVKAQTPAENIISSDFKNMKKDNHNYYSLLENDNFLNRSTLALGLDAMRLITKDQSITIVGIGGLGSIIAENLIHLGFSSLNIIDNDYIEKSNLNRIVGAYYSDAENQTKKVSAIKRHLNNINPKAKINDYLNDVHDIEIENGYSSK
jgi:hypothetical protein